MYGCFRFLLSFGAFQNKYGETPTAWNIGDATGKDTNRSTSLVDRIPFTTWPLVEQLWNPVEPSGDFSPANTLQFNPLKILVLLYMPLEESTKRYYVPFDTNRVIRLSRVPCGTPPLVSIDGDPPYIEYNGYYVFMGTVAAKHPMWIIADYISAMCHYRFTGLFFSTGALFGPRESILRLITP